eukprot:08526.XXX_489824_489539_1 [CDS] Oithona nana genome sequencing.
MWHMIPSYFSNAGICRQTHRRERVKICPPTKTLTSLQALRGLWSIHYHNCRKKF